VFFAVEVGKCLAHVLDTTTNPPGPWNTQQAAISRLTKSFDTVLSATPAADGQRLQNS
jgi:hypothetical protein